MSENVSGRLIHTDRVPVIIESVPFYCLPFLTTYVISPPSGTQIEHEW